MQSVIEPQYYQYMAISNNSCKFLLSMIDDILDLSKLELDQFNLNKDWFSLEQTLLEIEDIMGQQITFKNLDFKVEKNMNIPKLIYSDEKRIKQILFNLIGNALKFTL